MSANLCSLERARLNLPGTTTSDDRTIDAMIAATSDAIRKYLRRQITLSRHDEILDGTDGPRLMVREYPIQSIESIRHSPQVVLQVVNTLTATNQQARVTLTASGLELVRVASGVKVVDTSVTWSSNATLQAVASAVTALGNGWSARVAGSSSGDFGLWPSQDLYLPPSFGDALQSQGALDCRGRWAPLVLHTAELATYAWDARGWLYRRDPWFDALFPDDGQPWTGGPGSWRVQYTAGYAEVPQAVVEACAEWVAILFQQTRRDPALATQALTGAISQTWTQSSASRPPGRVASLLAPYRRHVV